MLERRAVRARHNVLLGQRLAISKTPNAPKIAPCDSPGTPRLPCPRSSSAPASSLVQRSVAVFEHVGLVPRIRLAAVCSTFHQLRSLVSWACLSLFVRSFDSVAHSFDDNFTMLASLTRARRDSCNKIEHSRVHGATGDRFQMGPLGVLTHILTEAFHLHMLGI